MRRKDREVTDRNEIFTILSHCDVLRIGFSGNGEYPYIVPVAFGYKIVDDSIIIYYHGAKEGLKTDLLRKNPKVCIEADTCNGYVQKDNTFTCEYESIIGFGDAETVTGDERFEGLDLIMEHCGFNAREYNMKVAEITGVFKVTVHEFTGKRRVIKK